VKCLVLGTKSWGWKVMIIGEQSRLKSCKVLEKPAASGALQKRHQPTFGIKCHQIIAPADMGVANVDLRHRAATSDLHHVLALGRVGIDAHFFDVFDAFGLEDLFGPNAIGANGGGVHLDGLHVNSW
jgi:hypothetical protein